MISAANLTSSIFQARTRWLLSSLESVEVTVVTGNALPGRHKALAVPLDECGGGGPRLTRTLGTRLADLLTASLPPSGSADLSQLPIALVVEEYLNFRIEMFIRHARQRGDRMTPSASVDLEPVRLLQHFAQQTGWSGPCYAVCTPEFDHRQALRWATTMVQAGFVRLAVVAQIRPMRDHFTLRTHVVGDE